MFARVLFLTAALLFGAVEACAQQPVTVIGPVAPGDCAAFNSTTVIKDAGGPCGGGTITPGAFGAKGDGATDDTGALQAWINACQGGVAICFLPTSNPCYKTTSAITITHTIYLVGEGRLLSRICPSNATQDGIVINTTENHGYMAHFGITPIVTKTGGSAIYSSAPTSLNTLWTYDDLLISTDFNGMNFAASSIPVVNNVVVICSNFCINGNAGNVQGLSMEDGFISNAYIQPIGAGAIGINLFNVSGMKIVNTKILGNGLYGVQLAVGSACISCSDLIITNLSIEGVQKGFVYSGTAVSYANVAMVGTELNGSIVGAEIAGSGLNSFTISGGTVIAGFNTAGIVLDPGSAVSNVLFGDLVIVGNTATVGVQISTDTTKCVLGTLQIDGVATPVSDTAAVCKRQLSPVGTVTNNQMLQSATAVSGGAAWSTNTWPATNAQGDLLYGSAANVVSTLPKNTTATRYLANTGTSNNPAWDQINLANGIIGTLPVANGGTNCSVASGTCLDNITGFSSTGFLKRTGAGAYSFVADPLPLANGGTQANLTASNGGIFYSTASAGAILAGTATANKPLLSGATAAPTWAAITYPTSATSGGIPYFSSTTAISSSALLAANCIVYGGGAATAPATSTSNCPTVSSTGIVTVTNTTAVSNLTTAAFVSSGGMAISGNVYAANGYLGAYNANCAAGSTAVFIGCMPAKATTAANALFQFTSNDASNTLQVNVLGNTDATANNRRGQIYVIDNGVQYLALSLAEAGGRVTIASANGATIAAGDVLSVAGQMSTSNKVYMTGLSTATAAQTSYICRGAANEIISVAVANTCATSAARFKFDIEPMPNGALSEVMALQPKLFRYKELPDLQLPGFIADEALAVDPRLVTWAGDQVHGFRYEFYTAVLTKAVQELTVKVERLEKRRLQ